MSKFTEGFMAPIEELVVKLIDAYIRKPPGLNPWHRHGTVASIDGMPTIRFDGEESASSRKYPYIESYSPQVGDRVYLAKSGSTWIVLGKIKSQ